MQGGAREGGGGGGGEADGLFAGDGISKPSGGGTTKVYAGGAKSGKLKVSSGHFLFPTRPSLGLFPPCSALGIEACTAAGWVSLSSLKSHPSPPQKGAEPLPPAACRLPPGLLLAVWPVVEVQGFLAISLAWRPRA
jgi:hypothetical protein